MKKDYNRTMKCMEKPWFFLGFLLLLTSCVSMTDIAMAELGTILSSDSSGALFTGETDPELVADALPFTMKLYEMILASQPEDSALNFTTGRNFVLYANAFIQIPASMLPDEEWRRNQEMLQRAKGMYLRGRDYILRSLELTYPELGTALEEPDLDPLLRHLTPEDVPRLYWAGSAWIAAFSCDPFDFRLGSELYRPLALILRAWELDGAYNEGAIHGLLVAVYSSLPLAHLELALAASPEILRPFIERYYSEKGVSPDDRSRAMHHFNEAVAFSGGSSPSPYIALAEGQAVPTQDFPWFQSLLESALSIEAEAHPERRLEILIQQNKARWLLDHSENFFLFENEEAYE